MRHEDHDEPSYLLPKAQAYSADLVVSLLPIPLSNQLAGNRQLCTWFHPSTSQVYEVVTLYGKLVTSDSHMAGLISEQ